MKRPRHRLLLLSLAASLFSLPLRAEQQDAAPVDIGQLLQALKTMREQQAVQVKAARAKAVRDVQTAAASGTAAAAAWEEAVKQVQFDGIAHEGSEFRAWKDKEGDALKETEAQNAARLYFVWVGITLQRAGGTTTKDLLPQVVQFTKDVSLDAAAMEAFDEKVKKEKERKSANAKKDAKDDAVVRRLHDQILHKAIASGPPVLALKIADFLAVPKWENSPGNVDGIFQNIILPELRVERDPRLIEYWDMKIKREGENAAKTKLAFDSEKFTQVRRPELLWSKAQDEIILGQKNKAITEMFTIVKSFPAHPNAANWITNLEALLLPPVPGAPPAADATPAP